MIPQISGQRTAAALSVLIVLAVALTLLVIPPMAGLAQERPAGCDGPGSVRIDTTLWNPNRNPESLPGGISEITIPVSIAPGTYRVTLASSDGHNDKPEQTDQTEEQWFVVLDDDGGYTSPPIDDLPDLQDTLTQLVDGTAQVTSPATEMRVVHLGAGTATNSINAECAIFESTDTPSAPPPVACDGPGSVRIDTELWNPNRSPEVLPGRISEITLPVSLAPGTYRVTLISSDTHTSKPDQTDQLEEQWFVVLDDDGGYTSPPIDDLPDLQNTLTQVVDPAAQVGSPVTQMRVVHLGAGTSINSIVASCAIFEPTEAGEIVVVKEVDEPPPSAQQFVFHTSYGPDFDLGDDDENRSGPLAPGTYSIAEDASDLWLARAECDDGSDPGSVELEAGETVTCTFQNAFRPGRGQIIVEVVTIPAGSDQEFPFTPSYQDGFNLQDGEQNDSDLLDPGPYSVTEVVPEGWTLTSATCDDGSPVDTIALSEDEVITCTFVNELELQPVPQCDLAVILSDGPAAGQAVDPVTGDPLITAPGDQFIYFIEVTNSECGQAVTDVVAELTFDNQVVFDPALLSTGCELIAGIGVCEIGTVPPGDVVMISVNVIVRPDSPADDALLSSVFITHPDLANELSEANNRDDELTAAFGVGVQGIVVGGDSGVLPQVLPLTGAESEDLALVALAALLTGLLLLTLAPKPAIPTSGQSGEPAEDPWAAYEAWVAARDEFLSGI